MNAQQAAQKMLDLQEAMQKVAALQDEIQEYVLESKKSFTVGDMVATYYKPSTTTDWQAGALQSQHTDLNWAMEQNTKEAYNWKRVCESLLLDPETLPTKTKDASVKFKIK